MQGVRQRGLATPTRAMSARAGKSPKRRCAAANARLGTRGKHPAYYPLAGEPPSLAGACFWTACTDTRHREAHRIPGNPSGELIDALRAGDARPAERPVRLQRQSADREKPDIFSVITD